jgi:hypothetical protein
MTDIGRERLGVGKTWSGKDLGVARLRDGKDLEATPATCRPWNEPGLTNFAKLPTLGCE